MPPTGKKCRRQEAEEEVTESENGEGEQAMAASEDTTISFMIQMKQQMDSMAEQMRELRQEREAERAQATREESEDGDSEEHQEGEETITAQTLRQDVRAMERAASRIAQFRDMDTDDYDGTNICRGNSNGKKSGSIMVAADHVKQRIDWPHMHVKRVTNGKRAGVPYKELKIDEFVYGFLAMLKSHKTKWDKELMLDILQDLMQDSMDFAWENARGFYEMLGLDVENGDKSWDDTQTVMKMRLLHSRTVYPERKDTKEVKKNSPGKGATGNLRCCALYQKKACEQNRDHHPFSHTCMYCAKATGMAYRHPEEDCFRKSLEEAKNSKKRE